MPSIATRILLFLSSYFPLLIITGVLFCPTCVWLAVTFFALGVVGLAGMLVYLHYAPEDFAKKNYGGYVQATG